MPIVAMERMTGPEFNSWYTKHRTAKGLSDFMSLAKGDRKKALDRLKEDLEAEKPKVVEADKLGPRGPAKRAAKIDAQIKALVDKVNAIPLNTYLGEKEVTGSSGKKYMSPVLTRTLMDIESQAIEMGGSSLDIKWDSLHFGKQGGGDTETNLFRSAWHNTAGTVKDHKGLSKAKQTAIVKLLQKWGKTVHHYYDDPAGDIGHE